MDDDTRQALTGLVQRGMSTSQSAVKHTIESLRHAAHSATSYLESAVYPAMQALLAINEQIAQDVVSTVRGERTWRELFEETSQRIDAAGRFSPLVHSWGRDIFGSATYPGETVIAQDECFRLVYVPPAPDVPTQPVAVFHAGGCIPYGDRIFRMHPDFNLFDRFRERGLPVYVMELRGDRNQIDYSALTIDIVVDAIAHMSEQAYLHNGERKMILEGYCGHGTQALTYVAAKPADADSKFSTCALFVTPVDGTRCAAISAAVRATPDFYHEALMAFYGAMNSYVPGASVQTGLDMSLGALFAKSRIGYFSAGWNRVDLAEVASAGDLTPEQQRDLAGTYWVSRECSARFPVPVGIARFTSALFKDGVSADGTMPYPVHDKPVTLAAIRDQTSMPVIGIFGGRDPVVPDDTAHILASLLGDRYTHVLHPRAGHISYVLSAAAWNRDSPRGMQPNPIDLMLEKAGVTP
ncbi:hypothetical protein [Haliangium ochraceum]|uniref:Uncharacterized protein n=1 Tax=Haliangium ochraceum (strain DSM 14365 / JCM 11303 / SMP-2) TaxID=502025 RepID=D0LYR9_HALO1|nr:hypothetical protein [Haliangium ochraceum]ACY17935.1 hypothetical protein Hoch_5452 [Haliangium ochraceum DSM 14365]